MKIDKKFVLREIAGEYIIIPVEDTALSFNGLITVNEVGVFLWQLLQEDTDEEGLLNAVLAEYEVDRDTAMTDIEEFLDILVEGKILSR